MSDGLSRRDWIQGCTSAGAAASLAATEETRAAASESGTNYKNYFGDLHNHNQMGYARGSLERSFEIARNDLDFYCFTPQACRGHFVQVRRANYLAAVEAGVRPAEVVGHQEDDIRLGICRSHQQ